MYDSIIFSLPRPSRVEKAPAAASVATDQGQQQTVAQDCALEETAPMPCDVAAAAEAVRALPEAPREERRRRRRALISAPIRVRGMNVTAGGPDEISTTIDVSRSGILFETSEPAFYRGMDVAVTFPYSKSADTTHVEQGGRVARVHELPDGRRAVAIALGVGAGEDLVDASGHVLARGPSRFSRDHALKKPLVLAVDADESLQAATKTYLTGEGYDVITVSNGRDAREVLNKCTPSLLIAEVEGNGLPGYDLCTHVKSNENLRHVHVVLTTRSAFPSDYSNAHALGAVVCMAKPYKPERLGHVVRFLVPPLQTKSSAATKGSPARSNGNGSMNRGNGGTSGRNGNFLNRFRFSSSK